MSHCRSRNWETKEDDDRKQEEILDIFGSHRKQEIIHKTFFGSHRKQEGIYKTFWKSSIWEIGYTTKFSHKNKKQGNNFHKESRKKIQKIFISNSPSISSVVECLACLYLEMKMGLLKDRSAADLNAHPNDSLGTHSFTRTGLGYHTHTCTWTIFWVPISVQIPMWKQLSFSFQVILMQA